MTKIWACYAIYNEEDSISESMRSIKAYIDGFVVVDSVFESNPAENTHSTDKTRDIAHRIAQSTPEKRCIYGESQVKFTEVEARNQYLAVVPDGDYIFVIDGDEVLYGQWAYIRELFDEIRRGEGSNVYMVPVYTTAINVPKMANNVTPEEFETAPIISTMGTMPRLFKNATGIVYTKVPGGSTPALTYRDPKTFVETYVHGGNGGNREMMFLVNNHPRQSFEGYQADFVWENAQND